MRLFRLLGWCATLVVAVWASSHLRLSTLAEDAAIDGGDVAVATDEATVQAPPRRPRPERISLAGSDALPNEIRIAPAAPSNYPTDKPDGEAEESAPDTVADLKAPSRQERPKAVSPSQSDESTEGAAAELTEKETLEPVAEDDSIHDDAEIVVDAASFKGVQPGQSTKDQLRDVWGEPQEVKKLGGATRQVYKVEPFNRITATLVSDKVTSLVIHLDKPFEPQQLADELQIDLAESVPVPDADGKILGRAFPERGVQFGFATGFAKPQVAQIVLEPIGYQPFVLRAAARRLSQTSKALLDINYALKLNDKDSHSHVVRAEVLRASGRLSDALQAARQAVSLDERSAEAQLTVAQLLADTADYSESLNVINRLLQTENIAPLDKARGYLQWGDCLAQGPQPDFAQSIKHHMQAIKLAQSIDKQPANVAKTKRLLVDAYLGMGLDIGSGRWQQKQKIVPQWIDRAAATAEDLVKNHGEDQEIIFVTCVSSLRALSEVSAPSDATVLCHRAAELGRALVQDAADPVRKQRLQWQLGVAMCSAMQISLARSKYDEAFTYGEVAAEYLSHGDKFAVSWPVHDWITGRLAYRLGAVCAIQQKDHTRALSWYAKAVPLLENPQPSCGLVDRGRHGEMFVSMAVSYWEQADKHEAVRLTEQGVKLLEQAADDGLLEKTALAIPYGNLASMHQDIGNSRQANTFAELAAKVEKKTK